MAGAVFRCHLDKLWLDLAPVAICEQHDKAKFNQNYLFSAPQVGKHVLVDNLIRTASHIAEIKFHYIFGEKSFNFSICSHGQLRPMYSAWDFTDFPSQLLNSL